MFVYIDLFMYFFPAIALREHMHFHIETNQKNFFDFYTRLTPIAS